ncbi:glycosyltransferase family 2 protein [Denitrobacterium detoxificans]|jgi:glycosyltransferase involved in cell wall biosynthesis|uniref:glycosyltransferase family 2 protein n=1 Tax=Denitrobacterium detoxificans TaxID=79604 RepID=UPI0026EF774F|nr:glycosyltransferase family 2 protein [Denitrobacterium detoxificans]MBE6466267.1 glycosyltransferase family 2 protein [Denitrobacterium detoxificans]
MSRICILLATYQGERFVRQQLDSLVAQTHADWVCVAQDDCSADATFDILQEYAQANGKFTVMRAPKRQGGAKQNFFSLIAYAQEHMADVDYFAFCDQDDIWLPNKLADSLEALRQLEAALDGAPAAICTDAQVVAEDGSEIAPSYLAYTARDTRMVEFNNLLVENMAPGCTMLVNRACFMNVRPPCEGLEAVEMHDWWTMLVAASLGAVAVLPQVTMKYRQHGDNSLGAQRYSLSDRAAHMRETVDGIRAAHSQARAFAETYADELGERELALAHDFGHMLEWNPAKRLRALGRDGFWRATPAKRVVQVLLSLGMRR